MDFVFDYLQNWFKDMAIALVRMMLTGMFDLVNTQTAAMGAEVMVTPSTYSPEIWSMVSAVAENVVVPIATLILTAVMAMEAASIAKDHTNLHSPTAIVQRLYWLIIGKFCVGVLLVKHAHKLTVTIFDVGADLIGRTVALVGSEYAVDVGGSVDALMAELATRDWLYVISTFAGIAISSLLLKAMFLAMKVILWGRIIEIYLFASVGAVPYVTLLHPEVKGIGQNYIKNLCALSFQGFFIFLLMGMYSVLTRTIQHTSDPLDAVMQLIVLSGVMVLALVRSKSIAKSIFAAS